MSNYEALRPLLLLEQNKTQIGECLLETQIIEAETILGKPLPPSFRKWLLTVGNDAQLFDGNLSVDTLLGSPEDRCIVYNLQRLNQYNWGLDSSLIVFGGNGQTDLWAFDSATSLEGEYPVVGIGNIFSPEGRDYKLWSSSFERFIHSQALWWTRYFHPNLPSPLDEETEDEWVIEINRLFDPFINLGKPYIYASPQTMTEIRAGLRKTHQKF